MCIALVLWVGGLSFYALAVIPEAHEVLGGHRPVGFITRRVTVWLNLLGVVLIAALAGDLRHRRAGPRAWIALGVMAVAQAFLFVWHGQVDGFLDVPTQGISAPDTFYVFHRVYLWVTAVEWLCAVGLGVTALAAWRDADRALGTGA